MQDIVSKQRTFFSSHTTKDLSFRITQLKRLETLLKAHQTDLDEAIYADFKKSPFENFATEIGMLLVAISEAKKHLHHWAKKKKVKTNFANFPASSYILPEPLGVCLVIGAWNYPYFITLAPVIAAIAAGNTVIIKPSEIASESSKAIEKLINSNFDPAYLKVVTGGVPETTALLAQKFDKIFFTGSTTVGKIVYKAAAEHLTPVTLELGGKSPAIISSDANLKISVKRLIWAKFLNAGQTCIAPDYVLVDEKVKAEFLALAVEAIAKANYDVDNANYTQIINDRNLNRLVAMMPKEKIYYGGKVDPEARTIEPTLLTDIDFSSEVMQEEIFGPILPVIGYTNLDDALAEVQKLPKPLACYTFTSSTKLKKKVLKELSFGGGAINDAIMHISNPHLPFGGVGESGIGSYQGEEGFKTFSHYKSILDKPTWLELPIKYAPYSKTKLTWLRRLIGI